MNVADQGTVGTDPGWGPAWRAFPPFGGNAASSRSGLTALRTLTIAFVIALSGMGVVAAVTASEPEGDNPGLAALVAAVGIASVAVSEWLGRRPLRCGSVGDLVGSYRSRFLQRTAISEAAALTGFVAVFLGGPWTVYLIGYAFALAGFWRMAPTASNLQREQERLASGGCGLSLVGVLCSVHFGEAGTP